MRNTVDGVVVAAVAWTIAHTKCMYGGYEQAEKSKQKSPHNRKQNFDKKINNHFLCAAQPISSSVVFFCIPLFFLMVIVLCCCCCFCCYCNADAIAGVRAITVQVAGNSLQIFFFHLFIHSFPCTRLCAGVFFFSYFVFFFFLRAFCDFSSSNSGIACYTPSPSSWPSPPSKSMCMRFFEFTLHSHSLCTITHRQKARDWRIRESDHRTLGESWFACTILVVVVVLFFIYLFFAGWFFLRFFVCFFSLFFIYKFVHFVVALCWWFAALDVTCINLVVLRYSIYYY